MAELYGKSYRRDELLRRVGNLGQVAGIREYTYSSGRAEGVRAVEINTGPMRFEILSERCLDVSFASYRGVPFGYISKSGLRHPAYYDKNDPTGFQDNFLGGVLTTCGMNNIGPASELAGRMHQLHGSLSNMPAEKIAVGERWDGDDCVFSVAGEVHHSAFYQGDLILRRRISARLGATSFLIEDEVENLDFAPAPCFLLYHAQFGFPFLNADARLITSPIVRTRLRPGTPSDRSGGFASFDEPEDGAEEVCFYHSFIPDAMGMAGAALFNPGLGERGTGVYIRYDTATLPVFVQWKMLRSREYVCGLEPSTAPLDNRTPGDIAANTLQPMEKRRFRLEIGIVEGEDGCRALVGRS
jgi:hypothetical protein